MFPVGLVSQGCCILYMRAETKIRPCALNRVLVSAVGSIMATLDRDDKALPGSSDVTLVSRLYSVYSSYSETACLLPATKGGCMTLFANKTGLTGPSNSSNATVMTKRSTYSHQTCQKLTNHVYLHFCLAERRAAGKGTSGGELFVNQA